MGTQYTALIVTPGLDQYNTLFEQVIMIYDMINLQKLYIS